MSKNSNIKYMIKHFQSCLMKPGAQKKPFQSNIVDQQYQQTKDYKRIKWKDETNYIGEILDGKMHGKGKLIFPNDQIYQGSFEKNHFHGSGKHTSLQSVYEGEWKFGFKHGLGKEFCHDGAFFMGTYEKGQKQGLGFYQWADGSFYSGQFSQNSMNGNGIMIYPDKTSFQGVWMNNEIKFGKYIKYKNDKKQIYIGEIMNQMKHGKGQLITEKQKIRGFWQKDELVGSAVMELIDGSTMNIKQKSKGRVKVSDNQYHEANKMFEKEDN